MSEILSDGTIVIDTPTGIEMASLLALRSALGLEVSTGMHHSRGSILAVAQRRGLTVKRTKHGAWQDVDLYIRTHGGPEGRLPVRNGVEIKRLPFPRLKALA